MFHHTVEDELVVQVRIKDQILEQHWAMIKTGTILDQEEGLGK